MTWTKLRDWMTSRRTGEGRSDEGERGRSIMDDSSANKATVRRRPFWYRQLAHAAALLTHHSSRAAPHTLLLTRRYNRGAMVAAASAEVTTGITSKFTRSLHCAIHSSRRKSPAVAT